MGCRNCVQRVYQNPVISSGMNEIAFVSDGRPGLQTVPGLVLAAWADGRDGKARFDGRTVTWVAPAGTVIRAQFVG